MTNVSYDLFCFGLLLAKSTCQCLITFTILSQISIALLATDSSSIHIAEQNLKFKNLILNTTVNTCKQVKKKHKQQVHNCLFFIKMMKINDYAHYWLCILGGLYIIPEMNSNRFDFSSYKKKIFRISLFSRDLYFTTWKVKPVRVHFEYYVKAALKAKLYKMHFQISNLMIFFRSEFSNWSTLYYFSKRLQSGDVKHIESKHFCLGYFWAK